MSPSREVWDEIGAATPQSPAARAGAALTHAQGRVDSRLRPGPPAPRRPAPRAPPTDGDLVRPSSLFRRRADPFSPPPPPSLPTHPMPRSGPVSPRRPVPQVPSIPDPAPSRRGRPLTALRASPPAAAGATPPLLPSPARQTPAPALAPRPRPPAPQLPGPDLVSFPPTGARYAQGPAGRPAGLSRRRREHRSGPAYGPVGNSSRLPLNSELPWLEAQGGSNTQKHNPSLLPPQFESLGIRRARQTKNL